MATETELKARADLIAVRSRLAELGAVRVESRTFEDNWLLDRSEIDRVAAPLIEQLDHRLLNDIDGLENPTTERLCAWLWQRLQSALPQLTAITVWETDAVRCTYRGPR